MGVESHRQIPAALPLGKSTVYCYMQLFYIIPFHRLDQRVSLVLNCMHFTNAVDCRPLNAKILRIFQ
jgi:hypothetical protein